jgi:hypothetical protein
MKLAPRIRKLEADCLHSLSMRLEAALKQVQIECEEGTPVGDDQGAGSKMHHHEVSIYPTWGGDCYYIRNILKFLCSTASLDHRPLPSGSGHPWKRTGG